MLHGKSGMDSIVLQIQEKIMLVEIYKCIIQKFQGKIYVDLMCIKFIMVL